MPIDSAIDDPNEDEDLIDPDDRRPMRLLDSRRQPDGELSDSEDEGEGGRRNHARYRERDSNGHGPNGSHKFGIGGGILNSGTASMHGAGPGGQRTVVRMLSSLIGDTTMDGDSSSTESGAGPGGQRTVVRLLDSLIGDTTMDVDSSSTESGAGTEPPAATSASDVEIKTPAGIRPAQSDSSGAPSEDNMVLDPPALTAQ